MSCANPQHHNGCRCDLNLQDQSRAYELDKTVAELRRRELAYITRTGELNRACGLMMGTIEVIINWPSEVSAANLRKILKEVHELVDKP